MWAEDIDITVTASMMGMLYFTAPKLAKTDNLSKNLKYFDNEVFRITNKSTDTNKDIYIRPPDNEISVITMATVAHKKRSHNKYICVIVRDYWPIWISQTQYMTTFGMLHWNDNEQQSQRVQTEKLYIIWPILQILGSQEWKLHNPKYLFGVFAELHNLLYISCRRRIGPFLLELRRSHGIVSIHNNRERKL